MFLSSAVSAPTCLIIFLNLLDTHGGGGGYKMRILLLAGMCGACCVFLQKELCMKKLLGAALIFAACGMAFAAEGEMESRFSPAFDVEVSLTKDTQIESNTKKETREFTGDPRILPFDIKGGVKIRLLDNLFLTPYVQYKAESFQLQTFGIGTGLAAENIISGLNLGLDAAYLLTTDSSSAIAAGMRLKPEVSYNFSDSLLLVSLSDDFNFFADQQNKVDKEVRYKTIDNELNAEVVFNVFNFLKPGINSGLYTNFVLNTEIAKAKLADKWLSKDKNTYEFGIGLITNPIDWFQARTGFIGSSAKEVDNITTAVETTTETKTTGWLVGVETTYKNFSFNADYTLSKILEKDLLRHKINMSVKYSF